MRAVVLASSFLDPVLGLDVHFEMVPTPAPVPTPIPNPFIGIVFDPLGLAAGIAIGAAIGAVTGAPFQGPVLYWTAFPATNTGTDCKAIPGHILIPPGVAWAPFPKTPKPVIHPGETPKPGLPVKPEDDAVVVFGSKTVTVMGTNAVRLGDIALSCSEPLRLPSSVVLAVPKGALILIGGPPSLDIMAALMASLRTRFMSDSLHALISRMKPSRFRNFLHRVACFLTGHPVDVASGKVLTEAKEIELPGPLPLTIERVYSSAFAARKGPLGHGWSLSLDQAVWRERGKLVLLAEDGRELEFDTFDLPGHRLEAGQQHHDPIHRLTVHADPQGAFRVVDHEGVTRSFAPVPGRRDGRAMIQELRSACGFHAIRYEYDAQGWLARVRDASGRTILLRNDALGRVVELWLPKPSGEGHDCHRRYTYDEQGDLVRVVDVLGHAWHYDYVTHLLTRETDRAGLSFHFAYDGLGEDAWCVRTWGEGGIYDHTLAYDKANRVTYVTNSLGATTTYRMNLAGMVVEIVDPHGAATRYEYDPHTLARRSETDGLARTTRWDYDARGNPIRVERPDGSHVELAWDARNRLVRAIDPLGGEFAWTYDAHGRAIEHRRPDGTRLVQRYDRGYLTQIIDPSGGTHDVGYDAQGLLAALRTPDGATMQWRYDALGRATAVGHAQGSVQARSYDLLGRPTEIREADGNVRALAFDPEGRLLRVRDADQDVEYVYRGLRMSAQLRAGQALRFEYDGEEQLRAIHDAEGHSYRFEYDARGELIRESSVDGRTTTYRRDAEGQLVALEHPSGRVTAFVHDAAGRVVEIDYGAGERETFAFRADGLLIEARNAAACVRLERDALGRIRREWQDRRFIESSHDALGRRVGVRSCFGSVQTIELSPLGDVLAHRHHDADARSSAARWAAELRHDALGLELERSLPGGVRARFARDELGRPVQQQLWDGHAVVRDVRYRWGTSDGLRGLVDAGRGVALEFHHDPLGRLAWARQGASEAPGHALEAVHGQQGEGVMRTRSAELRMPDALGRLFRTSDRSEREYGLAGELLRARNEGTSERRYVYDDDGNLIEKHEDEGLVWRYRWSGSGRLIAVERPDGQRVEFEYDALGRRIRKRFAGRTTCWLWDAQRPLHEWVEVDAPTPSLAPPPAAAEVDGLRGDALEQLHAGRELRGPPREPAPPGLVTWLFDPDSFSPAAKIVGDRCYSIVTDYLGTPVAMLDDAGRKVWSAEIDGYGQLRALELAAGFDRQACPFRWPGQYEDAETGLYYNRFRYYDPEAGQYVSRDPLGLHAGLAAYAYVDDPLTQVDVFGLAAGPPYDFATLLNEAKTSLNFGTAKDGAVFWSGGRMKDAQRWATANGKTTLEQTAGGRYLDSLKLFDSGSGLTGAQAAEVWDAASKRFAEGASGNVTVFPTGAKRMNNWGNLRTWWRIEKPALDANPKVTGITRRRKDGAVCGT
jgi:RHS repeat-associated protein